MGAIVLVLGQYEQYSAYCGYTFLLTKDNWSPNISGMLKAKENQNIKKTDILYIYLKKISKIIFFLMLN